MLYAHNIDYTNSALGFALDNAERLINFVAERHGVDLYDADERDDFQSAIAFMGGRYWTTLHDAAIEWAEYDVRTNEHRAQSLAEYHGLSPYCDGDYHGVVVAKLANTLEAEAVKACQIAIGIR